MAYIRDKRDNILCEIKKFSYNGIFMDVSSITVTVESNEPIAFGIGDYIDWDYDGMRYTLDVAAGVEKQARRNSVGNAFVYENLVFLSPLNAAKHVSFLDVVIGNPNDFLTNNAYSFYGTAWDYAKRLEANLCRVYGSGTWKVRIWTDGTCYDATSATGIDTGAWENKLIDVSNIDCLAGFGQIYELWGAGYVYFIEGGVNYVDFYDNFEQYAKAWKEGNSDKIFEYGKGNGLYKIRHTPDADHEIVTRLRAFGSQENLPPNYYLNSPDYHVDGNESSELAITNLMLPASQWTKDGVKSPGNAYLEQNVNLYGVREKSVVWDGSDSDLGAIRPSIYGLTIADLLRLMPSGTAWRPKTDKWPDTSQRIDKIVTGAQPTDNGAITEAGFDFTYTEDYGALSARAIPVYGAYKDIAFTGLTMSRTPSVGYTAEYRIVPTGSSTRAVSFDVQDIIAADIRNVSGYIIVYVGGTMAMDAIPCKVTSETISNTVDGLTYTKRYHLHLIDPSDAEIVFSTMQTGDVTFEFRAHIEFPEGFTTGYPVICNEYDVPFDLIRGNKSIDKTFSVTIPQLGFDLRAAISGESYLCMRSGDCQPREFPIMSVSYNEGTDTWYIRCKRVLDESTSTYFPNHDLDIAVGDEYYITGIAMPSLYVEIAAQKLLDAARAWLEYHSKPRMLSSVDIDNKIMAVEEIVLKEGMALPITDTDLDITPETQESRIIDSIQIEEGSEAIRTFTVTLRDKKEKSALDAAIRGATSGLASNSSVSKAINAAASPGTHDSLTGRDMPNQHPISAITGLEEAIAAASFFELDGNGNVKLKDQYGGLWAEGWVASGGVGTPGGGGGGGLIQSVLGVSDLGTPIPTESFTETFSAKAIESIYESLGDFGVSLSLSRESSYLKDANGNYFLDSNGNRIIVGGDGSSSLNLLNRAGQVLSSVELDLDLSSYATRSWVTQNFQPTISDLAAIRENASDGAAKVSNVQSDWDAESGLAVILNKPDLSVYALQSSLDLVSGRVTALEDLFEIVDGNVHVKNGRALYSDSWIAAGGIGSGGGGGGGSSFLRQLFDVYHDEYGVLRADGDDAEPGDALVYDVVRGWVAGELPSTYELPPASSSSLGGIKTGYTQTGKNYPVQLDSENNAYVSVPWEGGSGGGGVGTVTSVGISVPIGLSISGSPVTSAGTIAIGFASGYGIPTTEKQAHWDTAYGWGNHATAGYVTLSGAQTISGDKQFTGSIYSSTAWAIDDDGSAVFENINADYASFDELYVGVEQVATQSWVQNQGYLTQQSLSNYVTLDGAQTIAGAKTFTSAISANGGVVTAGDIIPSTDIGASLGYSNRRFSNGNIANVGTTNIYLKNSTGGNSGLLTANDGWLSIRAGSEATTSGSYKQINFHDTYGFYPNDSGVNLGYAGASNRWANIYGVNEDLSGDLALASTSHIDIGPLRIEYDATNKALHITKKDSNDTENYGLYADGFVSAGGVHQTS